MGLFKDKEKIEDEANKALEDKTENTEDNEEGNSDENLEGDSKENQDENSDETPNDSEENDKLPNPDGELECEICGSSNVIKRVSGFIQCLDCNHLNRNV